MIPVSGSITCDPKTRFTDDVSATAIPCLSMTDVWLCIWPGSVLDSEQNIRLPYSPMIIVNAKFWLVVLGRMCTALADRIVLVQIGMELPCDTYISEICGNRISKLFCWDMIQIAPTIVEIRVANSCPVMQARKKPNRLIENENSPRGESDWIGRLMVRFLIHGKSKVSHISSPRSIDAHSAPFCLRGHSCIAPPDSAYARGPAPKWVRAWCKPSCFDTCLGEQAVP
jgi:hypothetical protein